MTDRYLLVGNPIEHSLSPIIHQAFAEQLGHELVYTKQLVRLDGFVECVREFREAKGRGMNITLPFKLEAFKIAEQCSDLARHAQAVNTLSFEAQCCWGHNTDGLGLINDFHHRHGVELAGSKILILGAGGATQGVLGPLLAQHPSRLVVANRSAAKATALVAKFADHAAAMGVSIYACGLDSVDENPAIILNATSIGVDDQDSLDHLFARVPVRDAFCYDMSYGDVARFKKWSERRGAAQSVDGLGMLVEQAAEAFAIWRGVRPQTETILAKLRSQSGHH